MKAWPWLTLKANKTQDISTCQADLGCVGVNEFKVNWFVKDEGKLVVDFTPGRSRSYHH